MIPNIGFIDHDFNTYTHSPMINRKSIQILNKKYKKEHELVKKESELQFNSQNMHNYSDLLNHKIKSPPSPNLKKDPRLTKKPQKGTKMAPKSRNVTTLQESKTHQPKVYGRKSGAKLGYKSIADQLIDGMKVYDTYVS